MIFGPAVKFGIAYKKNEPYFAVFQKRLYHDFKVSLCSDPQEGSVGANMGKHSEYMIGEKHKFGIYDMVTFQKKYDVEVVKKNSKK